MSYSEVVLFVGLGAVVGFAGGLFAIGRALIAIPLLTAGFGFTQHDSQGTAMVMALASATVTLVIYARKKLLRVRDGLIMTACSTALGLASSQMVVIRRFRLRCKSAADPWPARSVGSSWLAAPW
jgi:hypothetical protein